MTNLNSKNNISNLKNCRLCPRKCGADRFKSVGFCRESEKIRVARAALHFWEEPCISGETGSGTVFFSGCNLKCVYCQNYDVSHNNFGKYITEEELAEIFLNLQKSGAENINLVSPTQFSVQICNTLKNVKKLLNIPVVYNTGGYESCEVLDYIKDFVDVYITDIKYFSSELSHKYSGAKDYFYYASLAAKKMVEQKKIIKDERGMLKQGVVIRHLVLPGGRYDSFKIIDFLKENFSSEDFVLSLMSQYIPEGDAKNFPEINRKITSFEYNSVVDYASEQGFFGFMQKRSSADKKYTPPFDLTGV